VGEKIDVVDVAAGLIDDVAQIKGDCLQMWGQSLVFFNGQLGEKSVMTGALR
jgi:hypothetical protein